MTAELGGFTGIVAPDGETVRFLKERRGVDFEVEPWMRSDPGAAYAEVIRVDCTALSPMVAAPGDPGNGVPLDRARAPGEGGHRLRRLLHRRQARGLRPLPRGAGLGPGARPEGAASVQLFLQYGTTAVRDYCIARGYDRIFEAAGARMLQPSCGACANCGPGSSSEAEQVTVSAINRNFPGRSGPGQVWLASPPTVVASALAGELVSFEQLRARHAAGR